MIGALVLTLSEKRNRVQIVRFKASFVLQNVVLMWMEVFKRLFIRSSTIYRKKINQLISDWRDNLNFKHFKDEKKVCLNVDDVREKLSKRKFLKLC